MKIAIGCDHGGFLLKEGLVDFFKKQNIEYIDVGAPSQESVDYPLYGAKVCQLIQKEECQRGILVCRSGLGLAIASNRFVGIRAVWADRPSIIERGRAHNDANTLCLGADWVSLENALEIYSAFINTPFDGGDRHVRRLQQCDVLGG